MITDFQNHLNLVDKKLASFFQTPLPTIEVVAGIALGVLTRAMITATLSLGFKHSKLIRRLLDNIPLPGASNGYGSALMAGALSGIGLGVFVGLMIALQPIDPEQVEERSLQQRATILGISFGLVTAIGVFSIGMALLAHYAVSGWSLSQRAGGIMGGAFDGLTATCPITAVAIALIPYHRTYVNVNEWVHA